MFLFFYYYLFIKKEKPEVSHSSKGFQQAPHLQRIKSFKILSCFLNKVFSAHKVFKLQWCKSEFLTPLLLRINKYLWLLPQLKMSFSFLRNIIYYNSIITYMCSWYVCGSLCWLFMTFTRVIENTFIWLAKKLNW